MEAITRVQSLKERMELSMVNMRSLVQYDLSRYTWHKYECGLKFLKLHLVAAARVPGYDLSEAQQGEVMMQVSLLERSKEFWGWWKLQWHLREVDLLEQERESREVRSVLWTITDARYLYQDENDPKLLANHKTHWGKILDDSFCQDVAGCLR